MTTGALGRRLVPCLLIFALLVLTLEAQSIWWDEGISLHLATSSWQEILNNRAANIHPPLYFLALNLWVAVAGATPFAARYFSVLGMTLLPAAIYRVVGRRIDRRTARVAALLVALAPPFIIYGQEVRAYAWLPLLTLALLSYVWPVSRRVGCNVRRFSHALGEASKPVVPAIIDSPPAPSTGSPASVRQALGLAIVQVALLGSHYAGVIAVGIANLVFAGRCMTRWRRSGTGRTCRTWLLASGVTGLLCLPWVVKVISVGLAGMQHQAGLDNVLATPVPAGYVAWLLGIFHVIGLPDALATPAFRRLTALVGSVLLLVMMVALARRSARQRIAILLAGWWAPLLSAPVIWLLSPQAHPRYLFPFVLGGWLLAAALVTSRAVVPALRLILLAALLAAAVLGTGAYLRDPTYARSDVRSAAAFVADTAEPGDVVLTPHTDWSLGQYDLGAARELMVPNLTDDAAVADALDAAISPGVRVFALDYPRDSLDPKRQVRALLAWSGVLVDRQDFQGVFLEVYEMTARPRAPGCEPQTPVCVAGSDLCLVGAAVHGAPISGAATALRLCWEGEGIDRRFAAAVRLVTPDGVQVASAHDLLLDEMAQPTDRWSARQHTSYHVLPVPVGALPRPYEIEVSIFDAQDTTQSVLVVGSDGVPRPTLKVAEVTPAVTPWLEASHYELPEMPAAPMVEMEGGVRLEGVAADRDQVTVGHDLFVTACWRVMSAPSVETVPEIVLWQHEEVLTRVSAAVDFAEIPVGRPVCHHVAVPVPSDVEDGAAHLMLEVATTEVPVAELEIDADMRVFTPPAVPYELDVRAGDVATLVGFDFQPGPEVRAGQPVTLTLVWRAEAGAPERDLKVFTHLLTAEGVMVAQHDAKPAAWTRPTSGWVVGEFIVDEHPMVWTREDVAGPAHLSVGFYDGETGINVPWQNDETGLTLPLTLTIAAEQ